MKRALLVGGLLLSIMSAYSQGIRINEIVAKNSSGHQDPDFNKHVDWIEIHNTTGSSMDLSGYYLTDSKTNLTKWEIPGGTSISANGFLLFYPDAKDIGLHTNFNLSSDGEFIQLVSSTSQILDSVTFTGQHDGISYGRTADGNWSFFTNTTPGATNDDASSATEIAESPVLEPSSGAYSGAQSASFIVPQDAIIYYTTDGTNPTTGSTLYSGAFPITISTVVKAIAVIPNKLNSMIESGTFLIGVNHGLPIVNITADNYTAPTGGEKLIIDGRVKVDFIETDGSIAFSQYADFKVSGNSSADLPQIQGKIRARASYGDGDFSYKMFPNKGLDNFESLLLRNASQDYYWTHMRDGLMSRILSEGNIIDMPHEGYRPAVIYVNGIYEGQINVREDDDEFFAHDNYGQDMDTYQKESPSFSSGLSAADLQTPTGLAAYHEFLNVRQQMYYYSLFNFTAQGEQGGRIWRDSELENQFQFHMHDWDQVFIFDPLQFNNNNLDFLPTARFNADEEKEMLQFYAAQIDLIYDSSRTLPIFEGLVALLRPEMQNHIDFTNSLTWSSASPFSTLTEWDSNVDFMRTFLKQRPAAMITHIGTAYAAETLIDVTHEVNNSSYGFVRIHGIKSSSESETGLYFANMPLRLEAKALPGYEFSHWEGVSSATEASIVLNLNSASTIRAVFTPNTLLKVSINEVQAVNNTTIMDEHGEYDDWIEIYNGGSAEFDLAGCYITDDSENLTKWRIPEDGATTTIPSLGRLLIWADRSPIQGALHVNFKLSASGDVLLVHPDGMTILDEISHFELGDDYSEARFPDGSDNIITCDNPSPDAINTDCEVVGVSDELAAIRYDVYPNPTEGSLSVAGANFDNIEIFNSMGAFQKATTDSQIDLSDLSKGIYFVTISSNEGQVTYKVMKR